MTLHLGFVPTCLVGERLIIALDKKWIQINKGKLLEFEAKIEGDRLILSSSKLDQTSPVTETDKNG